MSSGSIPEVSERFDGFGVRHIEQDAAAVRVEVLDVVAALATTAAEQAIRARASRLLDISGLVPIRHITRTDQSLSIVTELPEAVTLGDLLGALEFGTVSLGDDAVVELASATIRAVAAMHEAQPGLAHGALSPSHVLLRPDGSVLLTGAMFGDALQALKCNREQLWRTFGIAMPPSASLPRFDQRADVTQLGALVLELMLRRTMTAAEYPRQVSDLVFAATASVATSTPWGAPLRLWIQQALQLQTKSLFGSASDAARAFANIMTKVQGRRAGSEELQQAIRRLCSRTPHATAADLLEDDDLAFVLDLAPEPPLPEPLVPEPVPSPPRATKAEPPAPRRLGFLRNVFPQLRAN